jgi:hypothetical protein
MSASISPNLPLLATQAPTGSFGGAQVLLGGPYSFFQLNDTNGTGHASYAIATWTSNFVESPQFGPYNGTVGAYISMGGLIGPVGSAAIEALTTHVFSANTASPFYNGGSGISLNQLVLAVQNTSSGLVVYGQGQGGPGFNQAFIVNGNSVLALAYDNFGTFIPAGDAFTVTSTLTVYGDPAMFMSIDPTLNPNLIGMTGGSLPSFLFTQVGPAAVPEPSSLVLGGIALVTGTGTMYVRRRLRRRSRRTLLRSFGATGRLHTPCPGGPRRS